MSCHWFHLLFGDFLVDMKGVFEGMHTSVRPAKPIICTDLAHYVCNLARLARHALDTAIDSAASNHYFPLTYRGPNHDTTTRGAPVSTTNGNVMHLAATDSFAVGRTRKPCKKFAEVRLPLISVGHLCIHGMTVTFDIFTNNDASSHKVTVTRSIMCTSSQFPTQYYISIICR